MKTTKKCKRCGRSRLENGRCVVCEIDDAMGDTITKALDEIDRMRQRLEVGDMHRCCQEILTNVRGYELDDDGLCRDYEPEFDEICDATSCTVTDDVIQVLARVVERLAEARANPDRKVMKDLMEDMDVGGYRERQDFRLEYGLE